MIYDIVEAIEYRYGYDKDTVIEILMDMKKNFKTKSMLVILKMRLKN